MLQYSDPLPPDVAAMALRHHGIIRRASAVWDGVIGDLISKAPTGPHEITLTPTMDTLFLTRSVAPRRVIKRNGQQGDLNLTHPGWLLNLVAAGDSLATIAPDGMPEMDRLAIAITPDVLHRLEIGKGRDRLRLRSSLAMTGDLDRHLVNAIAEEIENPSRHSRLYAESLTLALVVGLARRHSADPPDPPATYGRGGLASWQLRRVRDYVDSHLADDVSLAELAALVGLSPSHFSRAFKATTGLPPHQYQLAVRVERAKHLLLQTATSLSEIAAICGFSEQSHFARTFRARVGISPGAWRRERKS